MRIIQLNPDGCRHRQVNGPQDGVDRLKDALEEPEFEGPVADYESLEIIQAILENAKLVFPDGEWKSWQISRHHLHIFEAVEKIIYKASGNIPIMDWIEPENMGWQMERLRIYPHGIDIYEEDPLDNLREPERIFAHIHIARASIEDIFLTTPESLTNLYPSLDPHIVNAPDNLWERIKALELTDGRQNLHVCAQIGMMQTGNMLLDYSETELTEGGWPHPEWREYPLWVSEARRADDIQLQSIAVADWVAQDPKKHMELVVEAINAALHMPSEMFNEVRARWVRSALGEARW